MRAFVERTRSLPQERAGDLVGVSQVRISEWRRAIEGKGSKPIGKLRKLTRGALRRYLEEHPQSGPQKRTLNAGELVDEFARLLAEFGFSPQAPWERGSAEAVAGGLVLQAKTTPARDGRALLRVADLLTRHGDVVRMLAMMPAAYVVELVGAVSEIGQWEEGDQAELRDLNARLLRSAGPTPVTVREDAKAAAEAVDIADRAAQTRLGVEEDLPRGEQRKHPRPPRGNRAG